MTSPTTNNEDLRAILATVLDGFVMVNPSGRLLDANEASCRMYGYSREELLAMYVWDLDAAETPDQVRRHIAQILEEGAEKFVTRHRRKDGGIVEVEVSATCVEGPDKHIVAFNRDITEGKRTDEARRESEARYRALVESSPDAITQADLRGRILMCNLQTALLHGYERPEELIGTSVFELIHPDELERANLDFQTTLKDGVIRNIERRLLKKDGSQFQGELSAVAIPDAEGKPTSFVAITRDISERKRAEEEHEKLRLQLLQSQKMEAIGQFAGGVAHDFSNLLTVINGFSTLALRQLPPTDPLRDDIAEILTAGERAAALTQQLLAFGRKQIVQPKPLDLNQVVTQAEKMVSRLIGEQIKLSVDLDPAPVNIRADLGQINQMIMNLVANARDAMPEGGSLTIETANVMLDENSAAQIGGLKPGVHAMLAISDSGIGMNKETKARIFEPFFTTKEQGKGTGLGLSTVYGIVKQNDGSIQVISEPGQGSAFKIYLPSLEGPVQGVQALTLPHAFLRGVETILVAEDDQRVCRLVCSALKRYGYKVLEAANAGEALLICERKPDPIHLLITDLVMPLMPGQELAERLRQIRPGIRVLYMSGYTDNDVARKGIMENVVAFLQKPFTPEELAVRVRQVLDERASAEVRSEVRVNSAQNRLEL